MAKRKKNLNEKSKPFTTVIIHLPMAISVCGDRETQKNWNEYFSKKNAPSKDKFMLNNFKRDLKSKNIRELFRDIEDSERWDRKKLEGLLLELKYPNIQEYLKFIIERAIEEESEVPNDKG